MIHKPHNVDVTYADYAEEGEHETYFVVTFTSDSEDEVVMLLGKRQAKMLNARLDDRIYYVPQWDKVKESN